MSAYDARIDAYIEKAAAFAQPILTHLRELIHAACPDVVETIKWGCPHFDYEGSILCGMAAFRQHCAFGFSKGALLQDPDQILGQAEKAMGQLGQIKQLSDLPKDNILKKYLRMAMKLNEDGVKLPVVRKLQQPVPDMPAYFLKALKGYKAANDRFKTFPPGKQKEYILWLEEAKTEATRNKRLETALEWISEGKGRNWKYQR